MTALRQRMIEELKLRNFAVNTQDAYLRAVTKFAEHFGKSPDQLGKDEVRTYLLHLVELRGVSTTSHCVLCGSSTMSCSDAIPCSPVCRFPKGRRNSPWL